MRIALAALALAATISAAAAQGNSMPNGSGFSNLQPSQAAQLNQAVQNNAQGRQALDQAEKKLNEAGHPSGKMLEKTRP